jgi:hypothetical protein
MLGGSGANITQHITGVQPDEITQQTLLALRRHALQTSLGGGLV